MGNVTASVSLSPSHLALPLVASTFSWPAAQRELATGYGLGCCLGARDGQPRCSSRADRRRVAESCLDDGSFEGLSRRSQTTSSRRRRKYPSFLVMAGLKRKCGPSGGSPERPGRGVGASLTRRGPGGGVPQHGAARVVFPARKLLLLVLSHTRTLPGPLLPPRD